ncbi:MAG: pyridoxamine kinase [Sedimentibacter saalensis]|uniref:pyridoxamine kinase n=1 Tax=Sedimentibacter saalensis TaxID=130788 RepID=UPI002B208B88|nr:pyridoxamine kinase [Sedimentibacter saalensis]MEA5094205.1 pyridoxamine kinase [Sedimentibacter saalensis]
MKNVPKIAAIHDMSGVGRCSMTVLMPVLSALGCQVCPLPTALLSNHSEYKNFYFFDFTEHMEEYYSNWEKNNEEFDCLYSGFIGSEKQINIMLDIINKIKSKKDVLVVVDPVMGDHGITYKTYTDKMVEKMSQLVHEADIITPNMTEASILLGEKYLDHRIDTELLKSYLQRLCSLGPDICVITGIATVDGENINACYDKRNNEYWKIPFRFVNKRYPGTGDLFTSLLVGYLMNDKKLPEAIEEASRFVSLAVKETYEAGTPSREGVLFEKIMKELYNEIEVYKYTKL